MKQSTDHADLRAFDESDLHGVSKEARWYESISDEQFNDLIELIRRPIIHESRQELRGAIEVLIDRYVIESNLRDRSEWWPLPKKLRSTSRSQPKLSTRAEHYFKKLVETLNIAEKCVQNLSPESRVEIETHFVKPGAWRRADMRFYRPFTRVWEPASAYLAAFRDS